MNPAITPPGGRRAWIVWSVGVLAYLVAVFHRYSLGVAGIEAAQRFHISASALAIFSVVQLLVYAAMQIPVGVLVDRVGSRRMLVAGALLMALGQVLFATAHSFSAAMLARVLLGAGDAMSFISVLRLVTVWFPPRRNPLVAQLTGLVGQFGAVLSAIPLVHALHGFGWGPTFLGAAGIGLTVGVMVALAVRDAPPGQSQAEASAAPPVRIGENLRLAWRHPGTRLGLWTHFVTPFPATAFALLWGFPFLVKGQGLSEATAGALLTLLTICGMAVGPLLGYLVGRHPFHRSRLVLWIVGTTAGAWTVVLAWPGRAPLWLLVVLILSMASNGPGSMIGFDYARTFNPRARFGSASGIVNVGGFVAALVTILLIGLVLGALTPTGSTNYSLSSFRWAFSVQYAVWALGVAQVLRYRRRARRKMAKESPEDFAAMRAGRAGAPT